MKTLRVLGIMSGTSIDSVDFALCDVNVDRVNLKQFRQSQFPRALQKRLHQAAANQTSSHETAQLHHDLGRFYAAEAKKIAHWKPQIAGLHGQTIFHYPDKSSPATWQIGEPAYLAAALKIPVISNFRAADLAVGGQGAPLATLFHKIVFAKKGNHVCVHNLGGISNVTSIDGSRGREPRLLAFDTGPANVLIDLAMGHFSRGKKQFDVDSRWASRGVVAENILAKWLRHRYFFKNPPKSTGRELFGEPFFNTALAMTKKAGLSKFDVVATFTEFTARSMVLNYRLHLGSAPAKVILSGGGANNPALVQAIRRELARWNADTQLVTSDSVGWPAQTIEPAAFALLAYYRWHKIPANLPETTGARQKVLLGQISE